MTTTAPRKPSTDAPVQVTATTFCVVPNWVRMTFRRDSRAMSLYLELCSYVDASRECWPSRATLADDLGISVDTLDRALRRLSDAGAVRVRRGGSTPDGGRVSNHYHLPMDPPQVDADQPHGCGQTSRMGAASTSRMGAAVTRTTGTRPSELDPPTPQTAAAATSAAVLAIWQAWVASLPPERAKRQRERPSADVAAKVRARLHDGFTVDQLCQVAGAWRLDTWSDRPNHNGLDVLMRNEGKARMWLDRATGAMPAPAPRHGPAAAMAAVAGRLAQVDGATRPALPAETQPQGRFDV